MKADVVRQKVEKASGWLDEAEAFLSRPAEEFLADIKKRDLAAWLQRELQEKIGVLRSFLARISDQAGL
ncbi:MAG TPA: hypothetical protein VJ725_23395 [Thermoanaerobaculia bacterium]|nr:hypothetical protein [Thermoanaerobaculia bacterium]